MIYVASPYSSPDPLLRKTRFLMAEAFVLHLFTTRKLLTFSPIVYCHNMAASNNLPYAAETYLAFNIAALRRAEALFVLAIKGWDESKGVKIEIDFAKAALIPTLYFNAQFEQVESAHPEHS